MSDIADPFGATDVDDDPFATANDVKPGSFSPSPKLEALEGKLVIMVPRKFEDDAPAYEEEARKRGEVRDRYTVDLVVLGSGPFAFEYLKKVDGQEERQPAQHTVELPALFTSKWVVEASVIGQLRKVDGTARPLLRGIVRRGPQAKDRRAGKTYEDITAAFEAFRRNPKGMPPRFSWQVDVELNDAQVAATLAWYRTARADGFTL